MSEYPAQLNRLWESRDDVDEFLSALNSFEFETVGDFIDFVNKVNDWQAYAIGAYRNDIWSDVTPFVLCESLLDSPTGMIVWSHHSNALIFVISCWPGTGDRGPVVGSLSRRAVS